MDYTLTRIDPNGENDRYPSRNRRSSPTPEQEVNKSVYVGNSSTRCMTW